CPGQPDRVPAPIGRPIRTLCRCLVRGSSNSEAAVFEAPSLLFNNPGKHHPFPVDGTDVASPEGAASVGSRFRPPADGSGSVKLPASGVISMPAPVELLSPVPVEAGVGMVINSGSVSLWTSGTFTAPVTTGTTTSKITHTTTTSADDQRLPR